MFRTHRLFDHFTYANVMATLALFMGLGGASYAAFSLPAHSVGARQLQRGSVTVGALGFPLGAASMTYTKPLRLVKDACNSPHRPGEVSQLLCPSPRFSGGLGNQPLLRVRLHRVGHLMISGLTGMEDQGTVGTSADVRYTVLLDGRQLGVREVTLSGGQREQTPIQALASVAGGSHIVEFQAKASYSSYEPGEVIVSSVSLVALALP